MRNWANVTVLAAVICMGAIGCRSQHPFGAFGGCPDGSCGVSEGTSYSQGSGTHNSVPAQQGSGTTQSFPPQQQPLQQTPSSVGGSGSRGYGGSSGR